MRYYDIVIIATQQRQLQTEELQKLKDCAAIDCNRRISVLLPRAQHRHDDVQRTYTLQQRRIHHNATPSRPHKIKSNPARKAATQVSVFVNRNQSQIRIEFDPNRRPATRALSLWC